MIIQLVRLPTIIEMLKTARPTSSAATAPPPSRASACGRASSATTATRRATPTPTAPRRRWCVRGVQRQGPPRQALLGAQREAVPG
eukprot:2383330-Prymnesium_polylepis.1